MKKNIERNNIKSIMYLQIYLIRMMWSSSPRKTILYVVLCVGAEIIPLIELFVWKFLLDYLISVYQTGKLNSMIYISLLGYLLLRAAPKALAEMSDVLFEDIKRKIALQIDQNIFDKLPKMGLAFFDNPQNRDVVEQIQASEGSIAAACPWVVGAAISGFSIVASVIVFLSYGLLFGIVFICTYIPGAIISYKNKERLDKFSLDSIPDSRKKNYFKAILTSSWAAKELRLYAAAPYFKNKYYTMRDNIRKERKRVFNEGVFWGAIASIISCIGVIFVFGGSIYQVLHGNITVGTMIFYIGLTQTIGVQIAGIIESFSLQFAFAFPAVKRYISFQKMDELISSTKKNENSGTWEIAFEHVSFQYPGSSDWVLKDFSMKLNTNEVVALAGANGAGKSTIVKLLLRLYEPTSGIITRNGIPYSEIPLEELHKSFGICFQDVTHYAMSFRENICVADCYNPINRERLDKSISFAGLKDILPLLPKGMDSHMTKQFEEDGVELSGGQWQRIGIARCMYRDAKMLVMDEPSSALDVKAEDFIFSSFGEVCKGRGGLLITHRLSNLMYVDRIILIEDGNICEEGTHNELIQKQGKYYALYALQAEKYSKGMELWD